MDVLTPGLKDRLWHRMRADLERYVVRDMPADLLLCPPCARWLPCDKFSIEHIVPQQALSDDPPELKAIINVNERTPLTLLCDAPLGIKVKGEHVPRQAFNSGCNNWKGRLYDTSIRRVMNKDALTSRYRRFTNRETIGCMMMAYLAMFERFGYQIVGTPSGLELVHPDCLRTTTAGSSRIRFTDTGYGRKLAEGRSPYRAAMRGHPPPQPKTVRVNRL